MAVAVATKSFLLSSRLYITSFDGLLMKTKLDEVCDDQAVLWFLKASRGCKERTSTLFTQSNRLPFLLSYITRWT